MLLNLLRNEVVLCDFHLLFGKISAHRNHLHTVAQRRLDSRRRVRRRDEEHVREIVVDVEVVVVESSVLLGIEHLKQR